MTTRMLKGQGQSREGCLKYRTEYLLGNGCAGGRGKKGEREKGVNGGEQWRREWNRGKGKNQREGNVKGKCLKN